MSRARNTSCESTKSYLLLLFTNPAWLSTSGLGYSKMVLTDPGPKHSLSGFSSHSVSQPMGAGGALTHQQRAPITAPRFVGVSGGARQEPARRRRSPHGSISTHARVRRAETKGSGLATLSKPHPLSPETARYLLELL